MVESPGTDEVSVTIPRRHCRKVKELCMLQVESLKKEEIARMRIDQRESLSEEGLREAIEGRMKRRSFSAYAAGFKAVYCNFFCQDICSNPYDRDYFQEHEKYDLIYCREHMKKIGLLHIYSVVEPELRCEVDKNKYYRSKEAGGDVGWEEAEKDYLRNHLKNFIEGASTCFVELSLKQKEGLEAVLVCK